MQLDRKPARNNRLFGLAWKNNFFPRILIIRGMTFEFEYLGEFEFIFENNLGSWSGDQKLAFDEKKECRKSRASVPLTNNSHQVSRLTDKGRYSSTDNYLWWQKHLYRQLTPGPHRGSYSRTDTPGKHGGRYSCTDNSHQISMVVVHIINSHHSTHTMPV